MSDFLRRLRERKLVQWALAYVAAAFALLQGIDIVANKFVWPDALESLQAPAIDPIRSDPRYQATMGKVGLPHQPAPVARR